jgi:hypothetical protein
VSDQLIQACRQFEAALLKQTLLESGFGRRIQFGGDADGENAAADDPVFGANASDSDIMQSLYADAMAQAIAASDPSGFSRSLAMRLEKAQT